MIRTLAAASLLALASCGSPPAAPGDEAADITVSDAFIYLPIAGRDMTMAGMTIDAPMGGVELVGAASDIAETVELHIIVNEEGRSGMRRVDAVPVPGDAPLRLARGAPHIMMFGVREDLAVGETWPLTLTFTGVGDDPLEIQVEAEIRDIDG